MAGLRDKVNILKQLLATLISTSGQPRRSPGFDEDLPSSSPLASIH